MTSSSPIAEACQGRDSALDRAEALNSQRNVALSDLRHPSVRAGLAYWMGLKDRFPVPAKCHLQPRELGRLLRNTSLIRVVRDAEDFEFRIVGDAVAEALRIPLQGRGLSEVSMQMQAGAQLVRSQCERVFNTGEPRGWRFQPGDGLFGPMAARAEILRLPLCEEVGKVDHILSFVGFLDDIDLEFMQSDV